jgi:ATP/maltotriose-dependent transcriptional regulator MalT
MSNSDPNTDSAPNLPVTVVESQFVVRTKLRVPRSVRAPVARERLLARLGQTLSPFTLVSAPPGFGKTTLVTHLSAAWRDAIAWFQIDRLDSDPRRFVSHPEALRVREDRVSHTFYWADGHACRSCLRTVRTLVGELVVNAGRGQGAWSGGRPTTIARRYATRL